MVSDKLNMIVFITLVDAVKLGSIGGMIQVDCVIILVDANMTQVDTDMI